MNLKKIIAVLAITIFFCLSFLSKPGFVSAVANYSCSGATYNNFYRAYTCSTGAFNQGCGNYPAVCTLAPGGIAEVEACIPDPLHATSQASNQPCAACTYDSREGSAEIVNNCSTSQCSTSCNISAINAGVTANPQCTSQGAKKYWNTSSAYTCNPSCDGWYWCDNNYLATYTDFMPERHIDPQNTQCVSTGVRAPSADYLCIPPPSAPTGLSANSVCQGGAVGVTFSWTNGAYATTTRVYNCDQTVAGPLGGCKPDDASIDRRRWFLLAGSASPTTVNGLTQGHTYYWFVRSINFNGSTDSPHYSTFTGGNCTSTITGQVYVDYNGNGVKDGADVGKAGVTVSDGVNPAVTTDANGNYTISNVTPGTYTESIDVPNGYTVKYPSSYPATIVASGNVTQNFGIQPPAPTCSGGVMTATPSQIYVGGNPLPATSTLNITGCSTGGGVPGAVTYAWTPATQGTIAQVDAATTTYTPPAVGSTYTQVDIAPSVSVCNPGGVGATCTPYGGSLTLIPTFTAAGQVYIDEDKNGQINGTDHAYTDSALTVTICQGNQPGGCATPFETLTTSISNGTFTTAGATPLPSGSYTAILSLPSGYQVTSPKPPVAVFAVGNASTSTPCTPVAKCDVSGNIVNLNFGISNSLPWMQIIGGDTLTNGFTDNIPATADLSCSGGAYASVVGAGGTHGIIDTESGGADFGQGQQTAANSWLVGGIGSGNYPYAYTLPLSNQTRTSYTNLSYLIKQSNIPTKPLSGVSGCSDLSNCTLPADTNSFPSGVVYTVDNNLTLNGTDGSYTFPSGGKYVILVNGKITINTKIFVPNGSFVLFSASDDINISPTVGDISHTTASNLEGYYSTDKSFNVQGKDATGAGANCATSDEDLRLNVAGAIVVNADTTNGGGFYYQRDMCADDKLCPVFTITERPDFILNSPTMLMFPRRLWQEIAP